MKEKARMVSEDDSASINDVENATIDNNIGGFPLEEAIAYGVIYSSSVSIQNRCRESQETYFESAKDNVHSTIF